MYGLQKKKTLESFRCWDEDDYQYLVLLVVLLREPKSFWRETVIVVVILLWVLGRMQENVLVAGTSY